MPLALDRIGLRRYGARAAALNRYDAHESVLESCPGQMIDRDIVFFHNRGHEEIEVSQNQN
jgi:hypothetical protein